MARCVDMAPGLLNEVGFLVGNDRFLAHLEAKPALRIDSGRVFFDKDLTQEYIDAFIAKATAALDDRKPVTIPDAWSAGTAGYSMMTIDVATEQLREATCQDLRDMISLANASGIGGSYMVMPQDVPPLMRTIACFKICYESSDTIRPYDYQQPEQLPFLYDMHQVMERTMDITITIPAAFSIDAKDLDIFLDYYPMWKKHGDIRFRTLDYPMLGITKPITVPGCAAVCFAETLAVHILFNLFDPEIDMSISVSGGHPTDMRNTCWAFGSPRYHLFRYLNEMILPNLCGQKPAQYICSGVRLETASPAIDEQAAMEKMATGLLAAMQGARSFGYAGVLCVDDVYSGTQFIIDLEIIEYIRETIEAFDPHPDIINTNGLYEECKQAATGSDTFISSINTATRFRHILPSSDLMVREKVRSWLGHQKLLKDRAREIALDRIRNAEPFHLPDDKQKELNTIYARAETALPQ
ncbi:MAG: trimethylamine methyltransferase family protein [Phycisphaerae bacterium]